MMMNHANPIVTPVLAHVLFPYQTAARLPVTDASPEANKQTNGIVSSVIVTANLKLFDCISLTVLGRRVLINARRPKPLRTDNVAKTLQANRHRYGNG